MASRGSEFSTIEPRPPKRLSFLLALALLGSVQLVGFQPPPSKPVAVVETSRGTFEIQFWPATAPKGVDHIVALIKQGFYRGFRVHRVTPTLMQFGDPMTRDMSKEAYWGSGGS